MSYDHEYIEDCTDWSVCFPLTGQHRYGDQMYGDEVIAFDAPLEDDALVEFVVRAGRPARIAQRDEPGVYKRPVLDPSNYVDWVGGRAAAPAEGRVSALRDRAGLFGYGKLRRRVSFKTARKLALPPPRTPAAGAELRRALRRVGSLPQVLRPSPAVSRAQLTSTLVGQAAVTCQTRSRRSQAEIRPS